MSTRTALPPTRIHKGRTKRLTVADAQLALSEFLSQTTRKPHLHPDALLSTSGISFSASSGPNGGLAIHHLRRIEAGLRGESLVAETAEDLAQFAEADGISFTCRRPESDVERVDGSEPARRKGGLKRQRSFERVDGWHQSNVSADPYDEAFEQDGEDLQTYQEEQEVLEGDVGEDEGAPVVQQNGQVPKVEVGSERKTPLTASEKAARKAAKKARRKERQRGAANG